MDMYNDTTVMDEMRSRLQQIRKLLEAGSQNMLNQLRKSEEFLEGLQYDKAVYETTNAIQLTNVAIANIANVEKFLSELSAILNEYEKCAFSMEGI